MKIAADSSRPRGTIELERSEARARASSLFISIDRGGWCGIADRHWREQEEGIDERVSREGRGGVHERKSSFRPVKGKHPRTLCIV